MTRRTLLPLLGALIVIIVAVGIGYYVSDAPTVPSTPADPQASESAVPLANPTKTRYLG